MIKGGFVYLLADYLHEGIYKIGVTRGKIENRIKKLQTGNSGEIYLFAKYETEYPFFIEKRMHLRYKRENVMNEWFRLKLEDALNFTKTCEEERKLIESLNGNEFFMKKINKNK